MTWRVTAIRADGSPGRSLLCLTPVQRSICCLALSAAGLSFMVEVLR